MDSREFYQDALSDAHPGVKMSSNDSEEIPIVKIPAPSPWSENASEPTDELARKEGVYNRSDRPVKRSGYPR